MATSKATHDLLLATIVLADILTIRQMKAFLRDKSQSKIPDSWEEVVNEITMWKIDNMPENGGKGY